MSNEWLSFLSCIVYIDTNKCLAAEAKSGNENFLWWIRAALCERAFSPFVLPKCKCRQFYTECIVSNAWTHKYIQNIKEKVF